MKALRGLRGQLALAFALVFGLAVGLAGLYQYRHVEQVLHQGDDLRLRARAYALLDQVDVSGPLPVVPLPNRNEQVSIVAEASGQPAQELFHSPNFNAPSETVRGVQVQRATTDAYGRLGATRALRGRPGSYLFSLTAYAYFSN